MPSKFERVDVRFPAELKALAERAALASGCSLSDYLVSLVRIDAPMRLQANNQITLANTQFNQFVEACDNAPIPGEKLVDAARKCDTEGF
jgi:uncharacterized protein (DUF1778 family)